MFQTLTCLGGIVQVEYVQVPVSAVDAHFGVHQCRHLLERAPPPLAAAQPSMAAGCHQDVHVLRVRYETVLPLLA